MKKTEKKTRIPKERRALTPRRDWWEVIEEGEVLELFPGVKEADKRLAYTFLQWCDNPNNLLVADFLYEYRLHWQPWMNMVNRSEVLKRAYEMGKKKIAANRHGGAMRKMYNFEATLLGIGELDSDYKLALEYSADLKKKSQVENSGDKVYVLTNDPQVIKRDMDEKAS